MSCQFSSWKNGFTWGVQDLPSPSTKMASKPAINVSCGTARSGNTNVVPLGEAAVPQRDHN